MNEFITDENELAHAVIGIAIDLGITDMITGAMWKYPDHVAILMDKKNLDKSLF